MAPLRLFGHERDRQRAAFRPTFRPSIDAIDIVTIASGAPSPMRSQSLESHRPEPAPMRLQSLQSHGRDPASPMQVQSLHLHGPDQGAADANVTMTLASAPPSELAAPCKSHDENCIRHPLKTTRRRAKAPGRASTC